MIRTDLGSKSMTGKCGTSIFEEEGMQLMTKREIKSLLEESETYGVPVEMPWNYIAKYNNDGMWHMESMDTDNLHSFDGDMSEILDMYSDLWRLSEVNYIFLLMTIKDESSYETLGGTVLKHGESGLIASKCNCVRLIDDFEDLRKFFEDD